MSNQTPIRVIGVDPGSVVTGYGVVEKRGNRLYHIDSGVFRVGSAKTFPERLTRIYEGVLKVARASEAMTGAVESIPHARHASSALKLGHARGVVLLALAHAGLEVTEHNPLEVKKSVVGYGKAEKEQVRMMVQRLLGTEVKGPLDRSDALAIAICHLHCAPRNWIK